MNPSRLLVPLLLLGLSGAAPAHDEAPREQPKVRETMCHERPEDCKHLKARGEEFCRKNPATCERRRAEHEATRQWCEDNPEECDKAIAERMERAEKRRKR